MCPILVQDARADPRFDGHPAVRFGFTRYLGVPVCRPDGASIGTLCFLDNRSDERLGEEDVEFLSVLAVRVNAEVERERLSELRVTELQTAAERNAALADHLQRAAEQKRRFIATVIHDLRQPITTLRTLCHVLRGEEDPGGRGECLDLLDGCVGSLNTMVDELLEYAAIEAGQLRWRRERLDLSHFLRECVESFRAEAAERQVSLRLELEPALGESCTDRAKLAHVVRNLVSNAVKFTALGHAESGDGCVEVRAGPAGDRAWRLEVRDNGPGMPESVRERIFDDFYQGPDAARPGHPSAPGRGLGLAIVRHLCGALGAGVRVESRVGEGSCFFVTFPHHPAGDEG